MRIKVIKYISYTLLLFSLFVSCKSEMVPGSYDESLDNLLKGLYFGMERQDFFDHCWDLNQEGETNHGTIANMVMYVDSVNFTPNVVVNFYPKFVNDKISELSVIYYYNSWAPWNKTELPQDSLHSQVVKFLENKYNASFDVKKDKRGNKVYYKLIGPLLVRAYKDQDEMLIKADIINAAYRKQEDK